LSGRYGVGDAALVVETFVGVVEEPENGGGAEDDGIDGEAGVPAKFSEESFVDRRGDGIAEVSDHVHEAKCHGSVAAADVDDVGPVAGLVHIDAIGGDAKECDGLEGGVHEAETDERGGGAEKASDGEEGAAEEFAAGAADENIAESAGDQAGEAHEEHGKGGDPFGAGDGDVSDVAEIFHVIAQPTDPEAKAVGDEEADAGDNPHGSGGEEVFEDVGIVMGDLIACLAAEFYCRQLRFVDTFFLGRIVAEPGIKKADPNNAQKSGSPEAEAPGGQLAEPMKPVNGGGKFFEGIGSEEIHHSAEDDR
jgi:hypothetical protein